MLNKARRASLVDMDAIRDDGFTSAAPVFFDGVDDFLATVAAWAGELRFDRQTGQSRRLALWCEAAGMVPQLERVAAPFGVGVYSSGGFDSLTDKHRIGREWSSTAITVLHLGDHDPSGVHCFSALEEDVVAFARHYGGGDIEFVRLAVEPEQARQYGLPSAPPKATDRRSFDGNETWQLEALDPHDLAEIVRGAIEARLDRALYGRVLAEEEHARQGRAFPVRLQWRPRPMSGLAPNVAVAPAWGVARLPGACGSGNVSRTAPAHFSSFWTSRQQQG